MSRAELDRSHARPGGLSIWVVGSRGRPGSYAPCGPHMDQIAPLATLATLAQISTPSAAHFLKSLQILV